jgi:hypothetical protein
VFEKRLLCCLMTRRAARAVSSRRRRHPTLHRGCCGCCRRRRRCRRCCWYWHVHVDVRDARGCVSTLRLGCQASSRCCSACAFLAAFTRCLHRCCVPSACLHMHGIAVVALWPAPPSLCRCVVEWDDGVRYLWAVWLCRFGGHSHTVLCVSDSMQCADWLSFDLTLLMLCYAMRRDAWPGSAAAPGAMV